MTRTADVERALGHAAKVRMMIFDVDGILTDGSLQFGSDGEQLKTFNVLDGHGIRMLQDHGIVTAIISARTSAIVARRAADLEINHVQQGAHDKRTAFEKLQETTGMTPMECGFVGDDWLDLPILLQAGFSASVPNAHHEVRSRVHYVTEAGGGRGAVRELCDLILRAQGKYDSALAAYIHE